MVCAGIITYNPDIIRLKANIDAIYMQVKKVFIYDNHSTNQELIKKLLCTYENVECFYSSVNDGIPKTLNYITEVASARGMKWILTLDQDSIFPDGAVNEFMKYAVDPNIGIICPMVCDKRRINQNEKSISKCKYVNFCITSGSFVNISVWREVGGYDDWMFIDLVDNEYCIRNLIHGYKILRINNVILDHELGKINKKKYSKYMIILARKLRISFLSKLSYEREVNPLRLYYATRNIIYLNFKYQKYKHNLFEPQNYIYNGLSGIIRGKNRMELLRSFINGIIDGKRKVKEIKQIIIKR